MEGSRSMVYGEGMRLRSAPALLLLSLPLAACSSPPSDETGEGSSGHGNTSSSSGTNTTGTGGHDGGTEWTAPACKTVTGTAAVTFTLDEGKSLAPTKDQLGGIAYTFGLVALDTPNTLVA